jgi:hypothetical protein
MPRSARSPRSSSGLSRPTELPAVIRHQHNVIVRGKLQDREPDGGVGEASALGVKRLAPRDRPSQRGLEVGRRLDSTPVLRAAAAELRFRLGRQRRLVHRWHLGRVQPERCELPAALRQRRVKIVERLAQHVGKVLDELDDHRLGDDQLKIPGRRPSPRGIGDRSPGVPVILERIGVNDDLHVRGES